MDELIRVKKLTKMSEKVAGGILSGVVKVSGFFTSSIVNSYPGKKFFSLFPGEIVLASLDGFSELILLSFFAFYSPFFVPVFRMMPFFLETFDGKRRSVCS